MRDQRLNAGSFYEAARIAVNNLMKTMSGEECRSDPARLARRPRPAPHHAGTRELWRAVGRLSCGDARPAPAPEKRGTIGVFQGRADILEEGLEAGDAIRCRFGYERAARAALGTTCDAREGERMVAHGTTAATGVSHPSASSRVVAGWTVGDRAAARAAGVRSSQRQSRGCRYGTARSHPLSRTSWVSDEATRVPAVPKGGRTRIRLVIYRNAVASCWYRPGRTRRSVSITRRQVTEHGSAHTTDQPHRSNDWLTRTRESTAGSALSGRSERKGSGEMLRSVRTNCEVSMADV